MIDCFLLIGAAMICVSMVNNLLAEGVFGRKSLSVGRHNVCFDASFCI